MAPQAQEATISASTDEALPGSLEDLILSRLDDDKAQDIVLIDLKGKSPMADSMIVASGRSHRHVGALADHVLRTLKDAGHGRARVEGLPHCDWVLIDAGDVVVHLFRPEVRTFYNIEKIWSVDSNHIKAAN
ncbi:ribosome silencing factor [Caulobacter sp. SLTY]|uniref:ribosome silencing factor n=1 Tax=Caulobacter sp. SLTY TaxID=2683262 RepID=UPI003211CD76